VVLYNDVVRGGRVFAVTYFHPKNFTHRQRPTTWRRHQCNSLRLGGFPKKLPTYILTMFFASVVFLSPTLSRLIRQGERSAALSDPMVPKCCTIWAYGMLGPVMVLRLHSAQYCRPLKFPNELGQFVLGTTFIRGR
jgi:hypothetical protein